MKQVFVIALALAAIGGGALIHALLASPHPPEGTSTVGAGDEVVSRRLRRLEERMDELAETIQGLAARRERPMGSRGGQPPPASTPTLQGAAGAAPAVVPPAPTARPPTEDLTNRANKQLQREALDLSRNREDPAGALRRWRELADRDLPEDERLAALLGLGRALERVGRLDTAAETYRRVIDEAPSGGAHSLYGQLHMGGREFSQGDYQASLAAADHVIGSRDAEPFQVVNARWMRANSLIKLGDVSSARQELQSMPEDHAGREGMEPLLQRYRAQLKRLD